MPNFCSDHSKIFVLLTCYEGGSGERGQKGSGSQGSQRRSVSKNMDNFWEKVDRYLYISQVGVKLLGHVGAQPRGRCFLFLMANHLVPENAFKLFVFL